MQSFFIEHSWLEKISRIKYHFDDKNNVPPYTMLSPQVMPRNACDTYCRNHNDSSLAVQGIQLFALSVACREQQQSLSCQTNEIGGLYGNVSSERGGNQDETRCDE